VSAHASFFSGTYGGDDAKLDASTRLECKICWHVYDPAEGDAYWQIPPGTPFARLPEHWSCPNCDGAKQDFIVVEEAR
jgi:rubredoxin